MKRLCSTPGCEKPHNAKGLCSNCGRRLARNGTVEHILPRHPNALCSIDGCQDKYKAKGFCYRHYQMHYRQQNLDKLQEYKRLWLDGKPRYLAELGRNRRARLLNAEWDGWVDSDVIERDKGICQICFEPVPTNLTDPLNPLYPNIDHLVALTFGGSHLLENVRLTHRTCNVSRTEEEERLGL